MQIGPYSYTEVLALAPMAGVTDRPFRMLCRRFGADIAASEMITADPRLWHTDKTRLRMDHSGEPAPVIVQIAGPDPAIMATAAMMSADRGADIIDINMGCPAKKVCKRAAGSALLRDERLVQSILEAVVAAVDIPVTLKIRTGWSTDHRNGVRIARIAQESGVCAMAVHGRTRACMYRGAAEYETTRQIKAAVHIPVIANGDIDSPAAAQRVLDATGADGVMIGRAAQGRPWIFREILASRHPTQSGTKFSNAGVPEARELRDTMLAHLNDLYVFYGERKGVLVARKHLGWYLRANPDSKPWRKRLMQVEQARTQVALTKDYFARLISNTDIAA